MTKLLVSFKCDWADEFEMEGFSVVDKEWWEKKVSQINTYFETETEYEEGFGTNESFIWTSAEDLLGCFEAVELSDEEAAVFEKYKHLAISYFPWLDGVIPGEY